MVILAIETSQREGGVALRTADGAVHVEPLPLGRGSDGLQPAIDRVVREAGLAPRDLAAVGVSVGPGGFTGLRIAVTTAKMLAMAVGSKLVAVPSALVAAEGIDDRVGEGGGAMRVALASKRETFWATRLERADGHWRAAGDAGLTDAAGATLDGVTTVVADAYLPESMRARCAETGVPITEPRFDPRACLDVAARRLEQDRTVEAHLLAPIYPRPPEAVTLWNARTRSEPR